MDPTAAEVADDGWTAAGGLHVVIRLGWADDAAEVVIRLGWVDEAAEAAAEVGGKTGAGQAGRKGAGDTGGSYGAKVDEAVGGSP